MRLAAWMVLLAMGCGYGMNSMTGQAKSSQDAEVDMHIAVLETPFGDGPHQRDRERAAAWLVEKADRSYPRIMALLEEGQGGVALIELLPRFGRAESIPVLDRLLTGPETTAWAAGQALALHPQAEAGEILRRALSGAKTEVVIVAADALGTRGDRGACDALGRLIAAPDAGVRYHVVQAAGRLGCLTRAALESMAASDADADVRGLAAKLLDPR